MEEKRKKEGEGEGEEEGEVYMQAREDEAGPATGRVQGWEGKLEMRD